MALDSYQLDPGITGDISSNTSGVSTNAGNISTNAGGVSTNAGNISTNADDILYVPPRDNLIINGGMQISQRATYGSPVVPTGYSLDRWKINNAGFTCTHQRVNPTSAPLPITYGKALKVVPTGSGTGYGLAQQIIEDPGAMRNRTITYSAWVKSNHSGVCIREGSSGAISAYHTGGGGWEYLTVTTTTNGIFYYQLGFWGGSAASVTTSHYFEFTAAKAEIGTVATPFIPRPIGLEIELCQRYFEKSYAITTTPGTTGQWPGINMVHVPGSGIAASQWFCSINYKVRKRVTGAVTIYSMNGTAGYISIFDSGATYAAITTGLQGATQARLNNTSGVPIVANRYSFHWSVDSEL